MISPIASRLTVGRNFAAVVKRNTSVVVGPPTKHISAGEKYMLAGTMIACFLFTPAYILSNLKHYKAPK